MTNLELTQFFVTNIRGIGPSKAKKVLDLCPSLVDPFDLINNDDAITVLKNGMGIKFTETLIEQLVLIQRQNEHVKDMVTCGIPYFAALSLVKQELTFKAFLDDPYTIGKKNEIPFEFCDKYAHKMMANDTISPDVATSRMKYFIEAMLLELENSGHTFAYLSQLTKKINQYQKKHSYLPDGYLESTVLLYLDDENIYVEKDKVLKKWKIYRKETADLENDIAYHIKRLSMTHSPQNKKAGIPTFDSHAVSYDEVQLGAIQSAAIPGLKIITGPPGSGKTAVINGIVQYFNKIKENAKIIMCAPTGRAAKHMTEITKKEASTIHKLLNIGTGKTFTKSKQLDCDMVICDEASMLNLDITFELLSNIKTGTVVYFVGDKNQLPAVGPGNVLHDIINSNIVPVYHLTKVYRQDGIILENAHKINAGVMPNETNERYMVFTYNEAEQLKNDLVKKHMSLYNPNEPFETQILIPSYKTECGIIAVNQAIQDQNPEPFIYKSKSGYSYKRNDKILMTKNHKNGLYQNGSVGLFIANMGETIEVLFDGESVILDKDAIDDMSLGYAISVHKSQGSEYKHVLLALPDKPAIMLKRNILYTAVTRAKEDIAIFEMQDTIQKSIDSNPSLFMQTGLKEKLAR